MCPDENNTSEDEANEDAPDAVTLTEDEIKESQGSVKRRKELGKFARELVWSDKEWDLLRRYFAAELSPSGPLSEEDLYIQGTYFDFEDESDTNHLKRGGEWEPNIPSDDTIIRRYITFDKFISLLMNGGFWLSNINRFSDQFEASLPKPSVDHAQTLVNFEKERDKQGQVSYGIERQRQEDKHTYVSCWRMGGDESSVFWDAYVGDSNGLALQTTVGKLKKHINKEIWSGYIDNLIDEGWESAISEYQKLLIGSVEYLEYENEVISNSRLSPARYFHKRDGFKTEREFRIVNTPVPLSDTSELPEPKPGIVVGGDLESIIDKIIFPPGKRGMYQNLVKDLAEDALSAEVQRSELEKEPHQVELD